MTVIMIVGLFLSVALLDVAWLMDNRSAWLVVRWCGRIGCACAGLWLWRHWN